MAREFKRSDRVADAVQRNLAQLISREVRDPRVSMVNINEVVVSRDLATAKVYVTFIGLDDDEVKAKESVGVLNNASRYLRTLLGRELTMRSVPHLHFFYDNTSVKGQALSHLIDKAVSSDSSRADDVGEKQED